MTLRTADGPSVAVVTGAGRGIGRAIASRLLADGFRVIAVDIDANSLGETVRSARNARIEAKIVDVERRDAVVDALEEIVRRYGRLDVVVNNAMWIRYEPLPEVVEETIDRMLGVGLKASIWTMQGAYGPMKAQGGGAIINISSPAALVGVRNAAVYSAVKGAILSLTREAAVEFGPDRIRVNAVAPGSTPTPGAKAIVDEKGFEYRLSRTPLGRLAQPEDIASAVSFLASPDAAFITGQLLCVDGGQTVLM